MGCNTSTDGQAGHPQSPQSHAAGSIPMVVRPVAEAPIASDVPQSSHALSAASATAMNPAPSRTATLIAEGEESSLLKTAPVARSLVNLDRESVILTTAPAGEQGRPYYISFKLDTSDVSGCEVVVYFLTKEEVPIAKGPPSFKEAKVTKRQSVGPGLRQNFGPLFLGHDLDEQHDIAKFTLQGENHFHLVIDLAARTVDPTLVTRQLSYAKLMLEGSEFPEKCRAELVQQTVVCGDQYEVLSTLYGTLGSVTLRSISRDGGRGVGSAPADAEGGECVICLSNPRDTVILHCRHVCLCSTCAMCTSSTWSFQCPICRGRVAAMLRMR